MLQISRLGHSGNLSFELVVLFTELLTVLYRQCLQGVERNLGERDYEKLVLHAVNLENYTYQQVTVICHHCRGGGQEEEPQGGKEARSCDGDGGGGRRR